MLFQEERQVSMQCRVACHVSPKQTGIGQRRIQHELSTDRLPENDSTIGAGCVTALDKWQQLYWTVERCFRSCDFAV